MARKVSESEKLLEAIGLEDVVPFCVSAQAVVAAAGTSIFVRAQKPKDFEGLLFSYGFYWQPEDLALSPVKVVTVKPNGTVDKTLLGPHKAQIGDETFAYRLRHGRFLPYDRDVGLAVTNGEADAYLAKGWIEGIWWSVEKRDLVRRALANGGAPWAPGSVFRGD